MAKTRTTAAHLPTETALFRLAEVSNPARSLPTPQRLAQFREQVSELIDALDALEHHLDAFADAEAEGRTTTRDRTAVREHAQTAHRALRTFGVHALPKLPAAST